MTGALSRIGLVLDWIAVVFQAAIALLLLAMLAINTVNIIFRSFLGGAFDWVFHWTILMFVWMVCLGFYVYMRGNRDVVVDLIASRMPSPIRRVLAIAADIIGIVFMYMVLSPAMTLIEMQTGGMETISLPIYVGSLPLFISAAFLTVHFALHGLLVAMGEIDPFVTTEPNNVLDAGQPR